jgi:hypothetical protein
LKELRAGNVTVDEPELVLGIASDFGAELEGF